MARRPTLCSGTATTIVVLVLMAGNASLAAAEPNRTQVITVSAVGADGRPANGFRMQPASADPGTVGEVFGCGASPAAVSGDIYSCAPAAAGADVCWPGSVSAPKALWCLDDPWSRELHPVTYTDALPQVRPTAAPTPFALLLDDGTQCRLRNGGAWGGRDDGMVGAYGCPGETPAVLVSLVPDGAASPIDRSAPLWTVKVGALGSGEPHLPPPQTHAVTTAWYAGVAPAR